VIYFNARRGHWLRSYSSEVGDEGGGGGKVYWLGFFHMGGVQSSSHAQGTSSG
jgi:hypothetical protein